MKQEKKAKWNRKNERKKEKWHKKESNVTPRNKAKLLKERKQSDIKKEKKNTHGTSQALGVRCSLSGYGGVPLPTGPELDTQEQHWVRQAVS